MERAEFKAREVARILALVESERRYYQELVAILPVPLAVLSVDGFVESANRAFRQLFKVRAEDLGRLSIDKVLAVTDLPAKIQEAQTGDAAPFVAAAVVSGSERTLRIAVSSVRNWSDENSLETLLVVEDLGASAPPAPAVSVPADLPAVMWTADSASLRFQSVLGSAEELTGFPAEHWIGHPEFFEERIYGEDRARVLALYRAAIAASGERASEASAEFRAVASSGALVWLRESIRAAGSVVTGVLTDISRRKELERQILTSSRIEALQRLAGRMAHDLNNPLMIVQGYAEEMFQSLAEDDSRRYDANEILKAAERMSSLTTQLIEFARPQAPSAAALDLGVVLPALESRLAEAMGRDTTLELIAPDYALWASADRAQLEETVLALAGIRAGSPDLTRLMVSWYSDTVAESVAGATLLPRLYACITLRDNGRALEDAQREALFESPIATGPGAALARAYATVRDWGGDLAVENGGPSGNTFAIYLPYLDAQPERAPEVAAVVAEAPPPLPERLRETILVVDDEPGIRGLIRKILRREHYNVLEAGSADEALTVSLSHAGSIHLLLTDVIMPGLTGPELARRMCEASPDLKVLFISGYTGEESALPDQLPAGFAFLPKPFTLGALVSKVRETLDS
jgi:CheY-like chemotaxis protein